MASDLISRDEFSEVMRDYFIRKIEASEYEVDVFDCNADLQLLLNDAPTVDAVEVVHGEWEECMVNDEPILEEWQSASCSSCGLYHTTPYMYNFKRYNYCPNCGADMRGEKPC